MRVNFIDLAKTAITSALVMAAVAAHADTYDFELTSNSVNGNYTALFQMLSTPDTENVTNNSFRVDEVSGTFGGETTTKSITFYTAASPYGAIQIGSTNNVFYTDAVLYTGGEVTPTVKLGTFSLIGDRPGSLTISNAPAVSAVPEPTGVTLSLAGIGLVGFVAARRRKGAAEQDTNV